MGEGMVAIRCQATAVWRYKLYNDTEKCFCGEHNKKIRETLAARNIQLVPVTRLSNNDKDTLIPCDMIVGVR